MPTGMCTRVPGHMAEAQETESQGAATMKYTHGPPRVTRRSFLAGTGGAHYGREWNLGAFKTLPTEAGEFHFGLRGAGYDSDRFGADATKFGASVRFRLAPRSCREIKAVLSDDYPIEKL